MQLPAERGAPVARRPGKASLFLIEITIVVAFFAAASAICMLLFARAKTLSKESRDITMAAIAAQNVAEVFKGSGDAAHCATALGMHEQNGAPRLYFDENWQQQPGPEGAAYLLELHPLPDGGALRSARVDVLAAAEKMQLYSVTVTKYIPVGDGR